MTARGRGRRSAAGRRRRPGRSGRGDRHAAVRLRRGPSPGHAAGEAVEAWGDGVAYATKAFLCMAMARLAHEEGMCLDVSTGGELHVALSAGVPRRPAGAPRQQQVRRGAGLGAGRRGGPHRDRLLRRDRPPRASAGRAGPPDRPRPGAGPRSWPGSPPGWRSTPTSSSAPDRTTPSSGSGWPRVRPPVAVDRLSKLDAAGIVEFVGIHAHLGSQVFALAPFARAIEVLAEFFAPLGLPELVVGGGLGVAYVNGEEAPPMAQWAASVRRACREAGIPDSVRVTAEPGRSIVAAAGDHPLPGGHGQGRSRPPDLRLGGRRDERQPASGALRQRLRGVPAPGDRCRPTRAGPGGGQALRDRRRGRAEASCPRTWRSATSWPRR